MLNKQLKRTLFAASSLLLVNHAAFASPMFITWQQADGGNGNQYALTELTSDWQTAEQQSIALGGHLVAINSAAEQQFISDTFLVNSIERLPLWIGLTDQASEGIFEWSNGDPLTYNNWQPGEPNNYLEEDYVAMNWGYSRNQDAKGTWNDVPLPGTSGFGGQSDGGYYGLIEIKSSVASVPAPTGIALLCLGLAGLVTSRKTHKNNS